MNFIPKELTRQVFRAGLQLKKNSPSIMFVGGVTGVLVSTVLACKATLNLSEALPKMKSDLDAVRENIEDGDDQKKAVAMVYANNAATVVKLYAPSVVIGSLSIGALTGSHVQLTRRNASYAAGYAALNRAYEEYRKRVQDHLGVDTEEDIYRATTEVKVDMPNGKKASVITYDENGGSPYARVFDESCRNWHKEENLNKAFITCQQQFANNTLQMRGHIMLNEVYELLGLEHSKAGAVVGWVHGKGTGDNYIDFRMLEIDEGQRVYGQAPYILLDFNVDGTVYDLIGE